MTKRRRKMTRPPPITQQIAKTYYSIDNPEGYAGASKLKNKYPKNKKAIDKWLSSQTTYTIHKPMKRRFPTRKYRVPCINHLWQIDLMEMIPYASINNGYKYIVTCVDVFSRFARAQPIKTKSASAVHDALKIMIDDTTPKYIQTDLGKEFYNNKVKQLFDVYKIRHYSVHSQFKAAIVERFNRTLREKLNRYFTHHNKKRWIDVLPQIINTYNKSPHRSLKMKRPIDIVNDINMWTDMEMKRGRHYTMRKPYSIGSLVRISRISAASPFRKNFDQNWSEEIFTIVAIDKKDVPIMYIIEDSNNQIIQGKFYHEELQVIGDKKPSVFRIEEILRTRGKGRHKQYYVKWYGYDKTYNSWISANNLVDKI